MHSVTDILGINPISRSVFDNAAAAVVGMARNAGRPVEHLGERCVGITMLGHTTPAVMRMLPQLEQAGTRRSSSTPTVSVGPPWSG